MKHAMPRLDSIEELARFWDTHDVTDYIDELQEVSTPVFERAAVVNVPLTASELEALRRRAAAEGVDEVALVHGWVRDKLRAS